MTAGIMAIETNEEARKAYDYFSVLKKAPEMSDSGARSEKPFTGVNQYGMVDIVQMFNNKAAQTVSNDTDDLNAVMESLSNILISAVLSHAGTDEQKQVSGDAWREGFNAMAGLFFSSYSVDELKYNDKKRGKDVVMTVISTAFDVNGTPTGNLKNAIDKYLSNQGSYMDNLSFDGSHSDPYTLMGFVNFVDDKSETKKHTCCLKAFFTDFTTDTVKISHSCKDDEKVFDFVFDVTRCHADFMLSNWETDPDFRARVKKFIDDHIPSTDYFDAMDTTHKFTVVK